MKLYVSEPSERHAGPILVHDEDHNDIAEFYHNEHATVGQSYETALALAQKLVTGDQPQRFADTEVDAWQDREALCSLGGWQKEAADRMYDKILALRCELNALNGAPPPQPVKEALDLAVNIIMAGEPGDSRAVSDEAVALAAVACGDTSDAVMKVIRASLALSRPDGGGK